MQTRISSIPQQVAIGSASHLTKAHIENFFHLPMHQACILLQCSIEELRAQCRVVGIQRWPYRKRNNPYEVSPVMKRSNSDIELSSVSSPSSSSSPVPFPASQDPNPLFSVYSTRISKTSINQAKLSSGVKKRNSITNSRKHKAIAPFVIEQVTQCLQRKNEQDQAKQIIPSNNISPLQIRTIIALPPINDMLNTRKVVMYTNTNHMFM